MFSDSGIKGQMARNINKRLEEVGFRNINVEERKNLAVLKRTKMPALLLEVGFINSDKDNQLFDENKAQIAEAIAVGIDETLRGQSASAISDDRFFNKDHGYESSMPVFADADSDAQVDEQDDLDDEEYDKDIYQILVGLFRNYGLASYKMNKLINSGYDATANEVDGLYQVRVGAFDTVEEALLVQDDLRKKGYESLIVKYGEGLEELE